VILRGLAVAASGFLFVFAPGLSMGLVSRRLQRFNRDMLYWGIGIWVIAQFPANFFQNLLYVIALDDASTIDEIGVVGSYILPLLGALIAAFVIEGSLYVYLRIKRRKTPIQLLDGLSLGFGSGLIAQVFTGLMLVGSGFRLVFGDTTGPVLSYLSQAPVIELIIGLSVLVIFRATLLVVTGVIGVLIARAVIERFRFFWLAMIIDTAFVWIIIAIQMVLGVESPGQLSVGDVDLLGSGVAIVYYILVFILAFRWLLSHSALLKEDRH
jgi:hypothetical protein